MAWQIAAYFLLSLALLLVAVRLPRRAGAGIAGIAVVILLAHALWLADDVRWAGWLPGREVWLWSNPTLPAGALLAGVAWRGLPPTVWQRVVLCVVLLGLGVDRAVGQLYRPSVKLGQARWEKGVCRQSTKATCGPAAVASALAAVGVTTSEAEMSTAGLTTADGTTNLGIYRALCVGLEGKPFSVAPYHGAIGELRTFPAVLSIQARGVAAASSLIPVGAKHAVAVLGREEEAAGGRLIVADPYAGLQRWKPEQLRELWSGNAFVVRRK